MIDRDAFAKYIQVMRYQGSGAVENPGTQAEVKAKLERSFFSDMYVPRAEIEAKLGGLIDNSQMVISFEGVEGSGKSTIVKKVISERGEGFPHVYLDFNSIFATRQREWRTKGDWSRGITNEVSWAIKAKYFSASHRRLMDTLYQYALLDADFGRPAEFEEFRERVAEACSIDRAGDCSALEEWYEENCHTHPDIIECRKSVLENFHYGHYVIALWRLGVLDRPLIVILDNIDRLPRGWQPSCFQFAQDFNNYLSEHAQVIVCIRHENAHPPIGSPALPTPVARLRIADMYRTVGDHENKLTSQEFHDILARRQEWFKKQHGASPMTEDLEFLTKALKSQYAELVLIDVANQSIRTALAYHCSFLDYLLTQYGPEDLRKLLHKPSRAVAVSFLSSCLYGWIAEHGDVLDTQSLNLPQLLLDCEHEDYDRPGCDLSYLILAYLLKVRRAVTLKNVLSELHVVGFSRQAVCAKVFELYELRDKELGNVISFWFDEGIESPDDIKDDATIELNYRGKRLVEYVSCAFTFVNKLLFKTPIYDRASTKMLRGSYYDYTNYHIHSCENVKFLARLARLHAIELVRISKRIQRGKNWYGTYAAKFCIERKLQLTRVINSHISFLTNLLNFLDADHAQEIETHIAALDTLRDFYKKDVDRIFPGTQAIYDYEKIVKDVLSGTKIKIRESDIARYVP